jgi:biotin carboxylase
MTLVGKKLLVMGGNAETGLLVETANRLGIDTIVVDPNPAAPAKRYANRSYECDGFDIDGVVAIARRERVDGVLVGVADILVAPYQKVCAALGMPCYATPEATAAFTAKDGFRDALARFDIPGTPSFTLDASLKRADIARLQYPLMLKPVDNGAGVGMVVCSNRSELERAVQFTLQHSARGAFLAERFMECDDTLAYYTIRDGEVFLSAMADRITTRAQLGKSLVCLAARYPSRHLELYRKVVNPSVSRMIRALGVRDGVLNIQFWVDGGQFYAYDPGFRLQGEAPNVYLARLQGFDHREMLITYALTGSMGVADLATRIDPSFGGRHACTLWFLLKIGTVGEIVGMEAIRSDPAVIFVMQRFRCGETVTPSMVGTERQVLARVYVVAETETALLGAIERINRKLKVTDTTGSDMIVAHYRPSLG